MDEDPNDAECTNDACQNVRNNLKMLMRTTKAQANDLQNFGRVKAEMEILRMKLVSSDGDAEMATKQAEAAVNEKELVEAELKQLQSADEFQKRKILMLQAEADEAEKHKQQANYWRDKYDGTSCLVETLNKNNQEVIEKYADAVKGMTAVGKQLVKAENEVSTLKASNLELKGKQKKLDKYLKSAIQVIDALSKTANVSKQTKPIKDLITIFRRDDVRLFFNAEPWKNSSGSQASATSADIPDSEESEEDPDADLQGDGTLGDEDEDDEDAAIEKLEKMLTDTVRESVITEKPLISRPDFAPKMKELRAKTNAPRVVQARNITKWPAGIKRPAETSQLGILDAKKIHSRVVPVSDFNVISQVAETRKKAKLSGLRDPEPPSTSKVPIIPVVPAVPVAGGAAAAGSSTIHGRKGKTVREQQAEMMKESVKDKVARMKAGGENQKKPTEDVNTPSTSEAVIRTPPTLRPRYKSLRMSECTNTDDEIDLEEEQPKEGRRSRLRSASVATPRTRSVSRCSEGIRRSSRVAANNSKPTTPSKPAKVPSVRNTPSGRRSRSRSRARTPSAPPPKTPPPVSSSVSRAQRAQARALMRGEPEDVAEEQDIQLPTQKERTVKEVLQKKLEENRTAMKRRAPAPAPINEGPPARTKSLMGVTAPKKKMGKVVDDVVDEEPLGESSTPVVIPSEESEKLAEVPSEVNNEKDEHIVTEPDDHFEPDETIVMDEESQEDHMEDVPTQTSEETPEETIPIQTVQEIPPIIEDISDVPVVATETVETTINDTVAPILQSETSSETPPEPEKPLLATPSNTSTSSSMETLKVIVPSERPKLPIAKSPKQLICSELGLDISDSEEEEEEEEMQLGNVYPPSPKQRISDTPQFSPVFESEQPTEESLTVEPLKTTEDVVPETTVEESVVQEQSTPQESSEIPVQKEVTPEVEDVQSTGPAQPTEEVIAEESQPEVQTEKSPAVESDTPTEVVKEPHPEVQTKKPLTTEPTEPNTDSISESSSEKPRVSVTETTSNSNNILDDILAGVKSSTKPPPVKLLRRTSEKPVQNVVKSAKKTDELKNQPSSSSSQNPPVDDLLGDIISGAKMVKKIPAVKPYVSKKAEAKKTVDHKPSIKKEEKNVPKPTAAKTDVPKKSEIVKPDVKSITEEPAVPTETPSQSVPVVRPKESPVELMRTRSRTSTAESVDEDVPTTSAKPSKPPYVIRQRSEDKVVFKKRAAPKPLPKPVLTRSSTAESSTGEDDLMGDILSGAKIQKKKPTKRPAPGAPSTSSEVKKSAPEKSKIPQTDPIKRTRISTSKTKETTMETEEKTSEVPTEIIDDEEVEIPPEQPTTSDAAGGKKKSILIDLPTQPRRRGRLGKSDETKPIGMKEMAMKNRELGAKKLGKLANTLKGHFRQALDLKVSVNELKRPMEEKGIILGDSIPLSPSDAVDVMMEFLRESSVGDQWAVLKQRREEGNVAALVNTEEENFLQISASLNEQTQELLELFVGRIISEFARRDTIDSKHCGRYARLFCHALRFSENSEEQKTEFMRRFFFVIFQKHAHHLIRILAFCLISEVFEHLSWLSEDIDEPSGFSVAFRVLLHQESDQAGVVNWLLNTRFHYAYISPVTAEDVKKAVRSAHDTFLASEEEEIDESSLKTSIYLAKTGHNGCLEVTFNLLKDEMHRLEQQFIEPHEKEKELKHRTVFTVHTVPTKMTVEEAKKLKKEFQWQKYMLAVMIDNQHSDKWKAVMQALQQIAPQIVTLRDVIESPTSTENLLEEPAIEPLRTAIDFLSQLISDFTNFPLKPTTLSRPVVPTTSPDSNQ